MTKFIVNNWTDALKTDINLFFTMTNCQIVRSRSLKHRISYKYMCLYAYRRELLANKRARSSAVIVKYLLYRYLLVTGAHYPEPPSSILTL